MTSTAVAVLRQSAIKAAALERALTSPEFARFRERALDRTAAAITTAEGATRAMADVIFREHVMRAITITIALLVVAIALPAMY
jgi:cytochrome P450